MKKTIIPAGTPGIFRPGFGEYPEPESHVITWQARHADNAPYSLHRLGASVHNNHAVYAWQYAPTPPPVDDFEAWCEGWGIRYGGDMAVGCGYRYYINGLLIDGQNQDPYLRKVGTFPTLLEAQRAAYAHFLESLKD